MAPRGRPNYGVALGFSTVDGYRSRELAIVVEGSVDVVIGSAELVRCEERLRSDDRVSEVWRAMVSECRRDGHLRTIWHHCVRESQQGLLQVTDPAFLRFVVPALPRAWDPWAGCRTAFRSWNR